MQRKALVVDDDRGVREFVADCMKLLDYDVEVCSNAEDALQLASEKKFDAVFTDYNLGEGMNGLTLARHLAESFANPSRIILMSGQSVDGWEIGGTIAAFLQKPFTFAEVRAELERVLSS